MARRKAREDSYLIEDSLSDLCLTSQVDLLIRITFSLTVQQVVMEEKALVAELEFDRGLGWERPLEHLVPLLWLGKLLLLPAPKSQPTERM